MPVAAKLVNEVLKMFDGGDADFENKRIFAQDAVAFVDFADVLYQGDEALFLRCDDTHEGHDGQAHALRAYFGVVAGDNPSILHAVDAVGHARC